MKENQFEQLLQQKLDMLPREIQPQRDLWPGIDLALEDETQHANKPLLWSGIAASIAVFGLVGLLSVNIATGPAPKPIELNELVSSLSTQHEKQKKILLASYEQQPALTDNWRDQLKELDSAATVIKTALEEDPGDTNLIKLLQQVYQQQIKLIQSVHQSRWL
ncbi:MAG: hypothetical protein O6928_08410 [Gammaproteobacteria bacterium]|nr:hypothetical protein [Gammaproteobacteria bacterium]